MILICTLADLPSHHDGSPRSMFELNEAAFRSACTAEDVYFWRDGDVTPLKRRNCSLEVPEWLTNRKEVDR